jgi:hypothetical protein
MKLTRSVVAGSVLATSILLGGCSDVEKLNPLHDDTKDDRVTFEYSHAEYDSFDTAMKTGRIGLRAFHKASDAAYHWGARQRHKIEHLTEDKPSTFITNGGLGEISLKPTSAENASYLTVRRDGGNFVYDSNMSVSFENVTHDYFGETAEPDEVEAFFKDPHTHAIYAEYHYWQDSIDAPADVPDGKVCDWQAGLTSDSSEVTSASTHCKPALDSLPHLAAFQDQVVF